MNGTEDRWASGVAYERFMGRWSRAIARDFVTWLDVASGAHWLDVGCGTGALSATILELADPASVTGIDPSEAFVATAREQVDDPRASFLHAGIDSLPTPESGFDVVVSGLVLNFIPDPGTAVATMASRLNPGGQVAAYVWDYVAGMEFLRYFWDEAVEIAPEAHQLDEGRRFSISRPEALTATFEAAGMVGIETRALEIETHFRDFADYWQPFLGKTGPGPALVASLDETRREALRARLEHRLRSAPDGSIRLRARAWGIRGMVG